MVDKQRQLPDTIHTQLDPFAMLANGAFSQGGRSRITDALYPPA